MSSRLGEILRRRGVLTAEQLALATRPEQAGPLAGELPRLGLVAEDVLVCALADEYGLGVVEPCAAQVPRAALDVVPHALARRHLIVPVALEGSTLTMAMVSVVHRLPGWGLRRGRDGAHQLEPPVGMHDNPIDESTQDPLATGLVESIEPASDQPAVPHRGVFTSPRLPRRGGGGREPLELGREFAFRLG
jgi:hypothetical protein